MFEELHRHTRNSKDSQQERINQLNRQLKLLEDRQQRLFDAVETGVLELDENLQRRAQQLKAARDALLIEIAGVRRDTSLPVDNIKATDVDAFGKALRDRLLPKDTGLAKSYLNMLVSEITVNENTAIITGSNVALAETLRQTKIGALNQVPTFMQAWRARPDSNGRPSASGAVL